MQKFSLLDLTPVPEGHTVETALANSVSLAQAAEKAGYSRFWLAEHHNMPGIASAATSIVIGHVAAATKTIRVGAGGIMLPNHSPLMVAEQFGTLATLYPNRIDLGLGRAPGSDMATARALRRHLTKEDRFPQNVLELMDFFADAQDGAPVIAVPGQSTHVPIYILGSSLYGAQLAAHFGLPYAFASHFAPAMLSEALSVYRSTFKPSNVLDKPYVMMAAGVGVADTDAEADYLRSSQMLAFAQLRTGKPGKLPKPVRDVETMIPAPVLEQIQYALSCAAIGSPETVRQKFLSLIDTYKPDELILTGSMHDHAARIKSFEMAAEILHPLCQAA